MAYTIQPESDGQFKATACSVSEAEEAVRGLYSDDFDEDESF